MLFLCKFAGKNYTNKVQALDTYHTPVMLRQALDGLQIRQDGVYVDATFGGGGHSRGILSYKPKHLYSFDQDADAQQNIPTQTNAERFTFVHSNFRYLRNWMSYYGVEQIDGLLADLGVSSHHFDDAERGFSFRYDAPLDMRMNRAASRTAADIVATYSQPQLTALLRIYGEVRNPSVLARRIVHAREKAAIKTTGQLADAVGGDKKELARVFQALRIEVNDEMAALREMLVAAQGLLRSGGRLVVLTYHSLEDRIVKNMMRTGNVSGRVQVDDIYGTMPAPMQQVGKIQVPSDEEQLINPRSRSAKLRIARKR